MCVSAYVYELIPPCLQNSLICVFTDESTNEKTLWFEHKASKVVTSHFDCLDKNTPPIPLLFTKTQV